MSVYLPSIGPASRSSTGSRSTAAGGQDEPGPPAEEDEPGLVVPVGRAALPTDSSMNRLTRSHRAVERLAVRAGAVGSSPGGR